MIKKYINQQYRRYCKKSINKQYMCRVLIFTVIILTLSCNKNDNNTAHSGLVKQFHKSIAIGENYYENPDILYAFKGSDQEINVIYPESDQLKWVQFNSDRATFKKVLQPAGSFQTEGCRPSLRPWKS